MSRWCPLVQAFISPTTNRILYTGEQVALCGWELWEGWL